MVNSIFYKAFDDNNNRLVNYSKFYFTKENHPFTITVAGFDYNNDNPIEAHIVAAESLLPLPSAIPQLDGYIFEGWYFNNTKWNFELDKACANMILKAKYKSVDDFILKDSLK